MSATEVVARLLLGGGLLAFAAWFAVVYVRAEVGNVRRFLADGNDRSGGAS